MRAQGSGNDQQDLAGWSSLPPGTGPGVRSVWFALKQWHRVAVTSSLILTTAVSGTAYAASATVTADGLNLRSGPGTNYRIVGTVSRGTTLEVLQRSGDWAQVRTPQGTVAWVAGWLLSAAGGSTGGGSTPSPAAPAATSVTVAVAALNLRSGAGTSYSIVTRVTRGTSLSVLDRQGDWIKVKTAAGQVAWAAGWLVTAASTPSQPPANPGTPAPPSAPAYEDLSSQLAVASPKSGALNLRANPSTSAAVISQTSASHTYQALGRQGDWLKIALPDGRQGWMAGWLSNLRILTVADFSPADGGHEVVALAKSVPVRRLPRDDFDGIIDVPAGTHMTYITSEDGWHQVRTASGAVGWVEASATKLVSKAPLMQSPVYTVDDHLWQVDEPGVASVTASAVNLRTGPGTGYKAITQLSRGTGLRVVGGQAGWYQVQTAAGQAGWLAASLVSAPQRPGVAQVQVKEISPQKKLITIQGSFSSPATVKEFNQGKALALYLGPVSVNPASLNLNSGELGTLNMSGNGVLLSFREQPQYRLVANSPGNVQIEFSTSLSGVSLNTQDPTRQVLTFQTRGYVTPSASYDAASGAVLVRFPGTTYGGAASAITSSMVQGMTMTNDATGLTVRVASTAGGRFLLRRGPNQVNLELLTPGLKGKTIVVDPGHGGYDPGAVGAGGLQEKTINLAVALKLKALLEQAGAKVLMTRTTDVAGVPDSQLAAVPASERTLTDLSARTELANQNRADLFISIHNNFDPSRIQTGTAVYWTDTNFNANRSLAFATLAQQQLVAVLGRPDDGAKNNDFYVIKYTEAPSVLVEGLFLSDPTEERMLADSTVQGRIAQALLQALQQYYQ